MRWLRGAALIGSLSAGFATLAAGDIYRWTDEDGHVHFTQDLSQVPGHARAAAEKSARPETRPSAPPAATADAVPSRPAASAKTVLQVPFERQGNAMIVYARVNDRVTAPFVVDTGASDVLIPAHVAEAAGVRIGVDTRSAVYQTANGLVEKPIVTLDAVQVGDARVENLRGSVSSTMPIGLLGGTFFNNFTFQVDPAARVITLVPNPHVRAGDSAEDWRARFREARSQLQALSEYLEQNELTDAARVRELEARRTALAEQLEELEREADLAEVPQAWRE